MEPSDDPHRRAALDSLWLASQAFPHLRLGQIIENAIADSLPELFYMNDSELATCIIDYINDHNPGMGMNA